MSLFHPASICGHTYQPRHLLGMSIFVLLTAFQGNRVKFEIYEPGSYILPLTKIMFPKTFSVEPLMDMLPPSPIV